MKVLLLIPPSKENVVRDVLYGGWCKGNRIGGATVPPLALLSVATVLKQDHHEVRLLDSPSENISLEEIKAISKNYKILLLLTSTMTFTEDSDILKQIKEVNPNIKTIIFGSHPTFLPEYCLKKDSIDIIVKREPEFIIRDLLKLIEEGKNWKNIKGVGYKDNKKIIINQDYPLIENLNELPSYDRSILPKGVVYYNPIIKKYPYTTSETSRGCPGRCYFCTAHPMYGPKLRYWSVEKVIEEIEQLIKQGYKEIYYRDETFTTFRRRNIDICNEIIKRKLKISWICNVRVRTADEEILKLMKKAGCHLIKVGVESGSQEILDKSNKGIKIEDTENLFKWAKKAGIETHAHLMIGMPGETKETIEQTIRFVKKINPTTIDVGICTPYPGSKLYEDLIKEHPEIGDATEINLQNLHIKGIYNKYYTNLKGEELEKELIMVYKKFYMNPRHIISNLSTIRSFSDIKRIFSASLNLLKFMRK